MTNPAHQNYINWQPSNCINGDEWGDEWRWDECWRWMGSFKESASMHESTYMHCDESQGGNWPGWWSWQNRRLAPFPDKQGRTSRGQRVQVPLHSQLRPSPLPGLKPCSTRIKTMHRRKTKTLNSIRSYDLNTTLCYDVGFASRFVSTPHCPKQIPKAMLMSLSIIQWAMMSLEQCFSIGGSRNWSGSE